MSDEDQQIISLYRNVGAKRLSRLIGRTPQAIHKRALYLNLTGRQVWTKIEDITVQLFYRLVKADLIAKKLSKRTVGAVHARAWRLGITKPRKTWGEDD